MATTNTTQLEDLLANNVKVFLHVKSAYDQCNPDIRAVIDDMCAIYGSSDASDDQKQRAMRTLLEALFPSLAVDILESMHQIRSTPEATEYESELDAQEETFADRLRAAMQAKGWTQERLAERAGVGQPAISNMLNRQSRPQARTVSRLAEALGVPPDELWPGVSSAGQAGQ